MASAVERLLPVAASPVAWSLSPMASPARVRRIRLQQARHPLPDARGVEAAQQIAEIARQAGERDLVICVIPGGASALLPAPVAGLTLEQKQSITRNTVINGGATIHELNTVRKHLSVIKGGVAAAPCRSRSGDALILSDVIGDDLDVIGSGPTVADRSTVADAKAVLQKYSVCGPGVFCET